MTSDVKLGDRTEAQAFSKVMMGRREQIVFLLSMAFTVVALFALIYVDPTIVIWGGVYTSLQAAEAVAFPRTRIQSRCEVKSFRTLALGLLAANTTLFASVTLVELSRLGLWSVAFGEAIVAATFLNIALTTHGCKRAFLASMAPGLIYVIIFPIMAWRVFGCPLQAAIAIAAVGLALVFGTFKLWSHAAAAQHAEQKARLELQISAEAANENRTFLDAILEYVPSILHVQDVEADRVVLVNHAMQTHTGKPRAELIGKTRLAFMTPDEAAQAATADQAVLLSGEPLKLAPVAAATLEGQRILRRTKIPISGLGRPYVLTVSEDVTEDEAIAEAKAAAAEALAEALARAEAANEAKSAFLATMSHEIRTPLNGVLGMVQAMAADELTPVQRERLGIVRQSGETLLNILNDVLDLSKIEAGRLELESIEFSLAAVAAGCQAAFTNVARGRGLNFSFAIDDDALGVYVGDPTRLRQILYNLLSNAMKFTTAGEVGVRMSRVEDRLIISVKDTGLGMTLEQTQRLFQKFVQADASTTRKFGGTGLGLAIVRDLALAMGGDIKVFSAVGGGTTFTVDLALPWVGPDVECPGAPALDSVEREGACFEPLCILVAEDNDINQLVIKTLLNQVGLSPCVVANGRLALEAWAMQSWDVILMDVQMPEMDGPTAVRLIRQREAETGRRRTPILALTANAMTHHVADYLDAGMDGHVAKPIEAWRLFSALEQVLEGVDVVESEAEDAAPVPVAVTRIS